MEIEKLDLRSIVLLKEHPKNSKIHTPEQVSVLKESFKKYGIVQPFLVDENWTLLAGHGRRLAALELGIEKVPVWVIKGLSENDKLLFLTLDNSSASMTSFDTKIFLDNLKEISLDGIDLEPFCLTIPDFTPEVSDENNNQTTPSNSESESESKKEKKEINCPNCLTSFFID
jgi:hypothetical protein